jgi:putative transcriptional regulator
MTIQITLKSILAKKRLSIVELSDRTGISVHDLEILRDNGAIAIRLKTLETLCRALKCQPSDLLVLGDD